MTQEYSDQNKISIELELERMKVTLAAEKEAWQEEYRKQEAEIENLKELLLNKDDDLSTCKRDLDQVRSSRSEDQYRYNKLLNSYSLLDKTVKDLEVGINELLNSKRWRIGNAIGELQNKMLFRKPQPMPAEFLIKTLKKYSGLHDK